MSVDVLDRIVHRNGSSAHEPVRVMTIRVPAGLHDTLKQEAHDRHVSLNSLAVAKLRITGDALDRLAETAEQIG